MATLDEEIAQTKKLLNLARDVKKKYIELSSLRSEKYKQLRDNFEPLTDTLEKLHKNVSHSVPETSHTSPLAVPISASNIADSKLPPLNNPYFGLRYDPVQKQFLIGNHPVIVGEHAFTFKGVDYPRSPGLETLLTYRDVPISGTYTKKDLSAYREILRNARDKLFDKSSGIPTRGKKVTFIKNIMKNIDQDSENDNNEDNFLLDSPYKKTKSGRGVSSRSKSKPKRKKVDIIGQRLKTPAPPNSPYLISYYDNVNELVYRLQLLMGEMEAGNDSPQIIHEIQSILSELSELGIID